MKPPYALPTPSSPAFTLAVVVACVSVALLVAQTLILAIGRHRRRGRIVTRARTAAEGERRAAAWLKDRGFTVLGAQVTAEYPLKVDGEETLIGIRADYLVAKNQRRFVVEVKTGALATRVQTPATRRQLLEYLVTFDVHGVLLLDMTNESVHEITFPQLSMADPPRAPLLGGAAWLLLAAGFVAAAYGVDLLLRVR